MHQLLTGCFPFLKSTKAPDNYNVLQSVTRSCVFCTASSENGFKVVWEDDVFIAFHDHRPAAQYHIQVIPKDHIASVRDLRKSDVTFCKQWSPYLEPRLTEGFHALVRTMEAIGNEILDGFQVKASMRRMGFHIPPFNSVGHLHLHVQALPYKSLAKKIKYPIADGGTFRQKGLSWFVEVGQAIRILEGGGTIGVFPC